MSSPGKRREALTQARRRGPIDLWGAPDAAAALGRALAVGDEVLDEYTHRFHAYPARLHPATARRALAELALPHGAKLLDPFCGSGTVLVEGVRAGLSTTGVDASPLAVLVARAKTWAAPAKARHALIAQARAIRDDVLQEGKAARRAGQAPPAPKGVDRRRQEALAGWFDPHVRREVEALREAAGSEDEILRAVLSAILVKVSRRAADSRAEVAPRAVARGWPARLFADRAEELAAGLASLWHDAPRGTPPAEVRQGDARELSKATAAGSFDAVLTSPPYAGTYDYAEQHGMRLAFLGLGGATLERAEMGARRSFTDDPARALAAWERDLGAVLGELAHAVKPGAPILLIIGDSFAGRRAVHADETLMKLARPAGLEIHAAASAARLPLGRAENDAFTRAPKREHLVWLRRSASDRPRPPRRSPSS